MADRRYSKATEAALFAMSLNCYFPGCPVPTVEVFGKGEARKNVQIAHVVAEKPAGPRWRADFPMDTVDLFSNLILLCGYHHPLVDAKVNEVKYPEPIWAAVAPELDDVAGQYLEDCAIAEPWTQVGPMPRGHYLPRALDADRAESLWQLSRYAIGCSA